MPATALPSTGDPAPQGVGCNTGDMFVIHNLFRGMFGDSVALVAGVSDGDTTRSGILADHLLELTTSLHHHHHGEDSMLWDQLEAADPGCAPHVSRMKAQHAAMSGRLDALEATLPAWRSTASTADRTKVAAALDAVLASLNEHLGDEEVTILPIASRAMTQSAWDKLGETARAQIEPSKRFIQLGFILASMPEAEREKWRKEFLPGPVRVLYNLIGKRQYEKHRALVYGTTA